MERGGDLCLVTTSGVSLSIVSSELLLEILDLLKFCLFFFIACHSASGSQLLKQEWRKAYFKEKEYIPFILQANGMPQGLLHLRLLWSLPWSGERWNEQSQVLSLMPDTQKLLFFSVKSNGCEFSFSPSSTPLSSLGRSHGITLTWKLAMGWEPGITASVTVLALARSSVSHGLCLCLKFQECLSYLASWLVNPVRWPKLQSGGQALPILLASTITCLALGWLLTLSLHPAHVSCGELAHPRNTDVVG